MERESVATVLSASSVSANLNSPKLLVAASGTGGHVFPAVATAEQLSHYQIEWLGVPDRLETQLVPSHYPLHTISVTGFQSRLGLNTLKVLGQFLRSIFTVRRLLQRGGFQGVFTTGGYIAAPAVIAARSLGLPIILHESNALPGKVTRWLSPWCSVVAIGFAEAAQYLGKAKTTWVGTPVRSQFRALAEADSIDRSEHLPDLPIPDGAPLIVVVGGSQGAVAVNQLVRQAAPAWFESGVWVVHLTGENDPAAKTLIHPQYVALPFYHNMAGLLQRATLAVSRAGAGTLTELAMSGTPAILIPYPFAAEDHQTFNAKVFEAAGAALLEQQAHLTAAQLQQQVLNLLQSPDRLQQMSQAAKQLAIVDSAEKLAHLVQQWIEHQSH
ncbi:MAG: undecaprenyldiphospho-muramoylpentapeptide beta-N-acetylglucosaminyltransferase [Elainella sp. Prado103]|nr:undecaprenyldiphospho-muramoylpentapeptide beta-N-acetylglucosaminyltransferase [Elainella sp. Prado103]